MNNNQFLFGKFDIIETLKKDSQSGVYLANHIYLNKKIVLKTLNTSKLNDQTILHRFKREAKILAKLEHPNIIKVLDFGTEKDYFYLSFEYFEGQSLREFIKEKLPDENQFIKIISQILSGLSYAHQQKIIHRDLKPENILINQKLEIKIADFGLALSENETQVTQQESIVGTPGYMSPEQIRGEFLDQRTDIFSFGIIAFELLTGSNPFIGKDITETINNILFKELDEIFEILKDKPEKISKIILKSLEKKREKRFQSVEEILNILGIEQRQPYPAKNENSRIHRIWLKVALSTLLIVLIAFLVIIYFNSTKNKNEEMITSNSNYDSSKSSIYSSPQQDNLKNQEKQKTTENNIVENKFPVEKSLNISEVPINQESELMITCYPWAEVYIDEQKYETTPLTKPIKLKPGTHRVKLIHPNFPTIEKIIETNPNQKNSLDINYYKYFGFVQFQIIPWGEIKINNQRVGITPLEKPVILEAGNHFLTITNPNFGNYFDTIFVRAGETLYYKLNLNSVSHWHNN